MVSRTALYVFVGFAALGALFSGVSTADFAAHLDRQIHAVTCSFIPGVGVADTTGTSGCFAAMMSPYAAVFRTSTWGGVPVALASLAVFFYLLFKGLDVILRRREADRHELLFLVAAASLPLMVSIIYFSISVAVLGELCKLCVGIYLASIGTFAAALWQLLRVRRAVPISPEGETAGTWLGLPIQLYGVYFLEGALLVMVPLLLYLALKPDIQVKAGACGRLLKAEDTYAVRFKLAPHPGGVPAVELLDPLCGACRGLHERLAESGLAERLDLESAVFPLDRDCNWMVPATVHPGACAAAEAILCAGEKANVILEWIFANQTALLDAGQVKPAEVRRRLEEQFPSLKSCLGTPAVQARLNKSLRWAVANSLPVMTPQLFVNGEKVCDEDTELGLEYTLARLTAMAPRAERGQP